MGQDTVSKGQVLLKVGSDNKEALYAHLLLPLPSSIRGSKGKIQRFKGQVILKVGSDNKEALLCSLTPLNVCVSEDTCDEIQKILKVLL